MDNQIDSAASERIELVLGVVAILLAILFIVFGSLNRSLQTEVATGQARIANAQTAANVNNNLIRMLAKSAAEQKDAQLSALLAQNGITISQTPPAPAPGAPPSAP